MHRILALITRLTSMSFQSLHYCFIDWTKPATTSLMVGTLTDFARSKSELMAENALLRQQLIILRRHVKRPTFTKTDRLLLVLLAKAVRTWKQALLIVQPETLLRWHRQGFRLFWKYQSRAAARQPKIAAEIVALIKDMARDNRLWGAERIRGELLKLGIRVCLPHHSEIYATGEHNSRHLGRTGRPSYARMPSRSGPVTFSPSRISSSTRCSPSSTPSLHSRKVIHIGVTRSPTDAWTAEPLREATAFGVGPKYLIRDNDGKFGAAFARLVKTTDGSPD